MNAQTHLPTATADAAELASLASLARGLAVVTSIVVVTISALAWGRRGLEAAGVGSALSVFNVFLLTRFAQKALAAAAVGDASDAASSLNAALLFKMIGIFAAVWCLSRLMHLETLPLALGLLVTVFCLVAAGLVTARRME
jgi:hypothetical protein